MLKIVGRSAFVLACPKVNWGLMNRGGSFILPTPSLNSIRWKRLEPRVPRSFSSVNLEEWIATLRVDEKQLLLESLHKHNPPSPSPTVVQPVTSRQLIHVGFVYALPFVGFGFLDNFIMIIAGDYIDLTLGTALGISTMAAAALGNTISDVAGIGSAWYIETLASKLGVPQPNLEPEQMTKGSTRWAINIGRAVGVAVGCILGMVPLLFLPTSEDKES